jgi:transcriptional regulator with XRE-family HTH domain
LSTHTFQRVLADLLRKARLEAGLSQEELAAKAAVSREYVNYLERGKCQPTVAVFIRLARAVGMSPADLIQQVEQSTDKH